MLPLYDAHQHFQFEALTPHRTAIAADLRAIGLKRAVINGTSEEEWPVVAALARQYDWILPSYGVHPWDSGNRSSRWQTALRSQLEADPTAGVGEIGLDRWIIEGMKPDDPRLTGLRVAPLEEQREVFSWQFALATELNRAASIHCVQAFGALLDVLGKIKLPDRGFLLHCYSGPAEMVGQFADLGAYFSFNGSFLGRLPGEKTRPGKKDFLHTYTLIPSDRLLVETDAPATPLPLSHEKYSLPVSTEGERPNHPANLLATYQALAAIRGEPIEKLAAQVELNFQRLFQSS
jgi:TatD DNase family protein